MDNQEQSTVANNYKFFKTLAIGFTIVSFGIAIGVFGYILGTRNSQSLQDRVDEQNPIIFPSPGESGNKPLPSTLPETENWKTYTLTTVDIQFKLPSQITKEGNYVENLLTADKGNNICFQLSEETSLRIISRVFAGGIGACGDSRSSFLIGGTSVDYEAGRGGIFTDYQGFVEKNGKYYVRYVTGTKNEIPQDVVTRINKNYGIPIIKVKSKKSEESSWPLPGTPEEGWIGALINTDISLYPGGVLINTKGPLYPGLAVKMKLTKDLNEELFDQILSTFRFTNP